uniref:Cadherin-5 n=1 Tax=Gasterosteus aculeatus aculeatus TaxID=481459 RepID=G3PDV1_GASAC|nr:cadherin-5 [Gasterosteus aculeatus aculeatus]
MMARLLLWTLGLMAIMSVALAVAVDFVLPVAEGHHEIVKKESHPILSRQKRDWIWNALYVEEEKPAPVAYRIGKLKSSKTVDVKKFEISGEGANRIFFVDSKGDLFVNQTLDREKNSMYKLTAKMFDGNGELIEDSGDFVVQVTDINDNIPVFPRTYNGSIMERSPIGTEVVEVKATDADDNTTANGDLRYSLTQREDFAAFDIDSIKGVISSRTNTLDRETKSQYVVVVKAQDMRGMPSGSTSTTSVTITVGDTNDNHASFTQRTYELNVREDHKLNEKIGTLQVDDRDEIRNKVPVFSIPDKKTPWIFGVEVSKPNKDGDLVLKQALDYETMSSYTFNVKLHESLDVTDVVNSATTTARVTINVLDVDEAPVFNKPVYTFDVAEERDVRYIGAVSARDPDKAKKRIEYSILDPNCPIRIHQETGQLSTRRKLDRELEAKHVVEVRAREGSDGLESSVKVEITVLDINDNKPELIVDDIFVCENDPTGTVIGTLRAADKDDQPASFSFSVQSSNFSVRSRGNGTSDLTVKQGPFSLDDPADYSVDVHISDGGQPAQTSVTKLAIKSCRCDARRIPTQCKAGARRMGVSVHALIAILLCILTILVIVILFVMRKRYQKDSLSNLKNSGEIHEQLVTYDEEGGGEMDTNGYDVSILSSACQGGSLLRHPDQPHPSLYAMVQKPHHHAPPTARKGDMAVMIEVKKDEADHDRDGFPYDTLHIYGYEGPESLAGSLSSLGSSSTGSNLDYDFLNEWGPRFRTLAELYGVDAPDYYHQY